jgi:tetratricopeptide (TPR) repeat protein
MKIDKTSKNIGFKNMIILRNLCALLILLSVVACDDNDAKSTSQPQPFPETNLSQAPSDIEQIKAYLFDNPNDFDALSALGDKYFEAGQYFEAIQTYDKALAVNPECTDCLNDQGLAYFYAGDANSAIDSLDKAIAINPDYPNTWLSKGFILISEGRYQEAIAPLNKVKELDTVGNLSIEADKFLAMAAENTP